MGILDVNTGEQRTTEDMNTREVIRTFVTDNYLEGGQSATFADGDSFLEEGIIDSVGVLELVAFLEEAFDFRVEDEEIIPENLDSVNRIVIYTQSKLANNKS